MAHAMQREFTPLRIAVLTVSDTRTPDTDTAGDVLVQLLGAAGHELADRQLVVDDIYQLRARVSQWIAEPSVQVILITGGTGFSARDHVPLAISPLLDRQMAGFGELFRQLSYGEIGTSALQSRALAGFANGAFIACMPGSPGACATAWNGILQQQLDNRTGPCNAVAHIRSHRQDTLACASRSSPLN
ncbi:molybdenum cofactor biosynthesis protein B [Halopseudomonas salina]|uniref:Molybdenum cofactor biosynthesis protein B n=1 Tax=Halopseudomonas salina TaxID=1323744 RepID=A0ABQ1PJI3_9GAMM|nr:molybdenum cofactor biosynthesis protein B [Halopseudomonas salina]GGC98323.1 molybdenum cofactor biosynthesis protein B [Halopseudomonas salina]